MSDATDDPDAFLRDPDLLVRFETIDVMDDAEVRRLCEELGIDVEAASAQSRYTAGLLKRASSDAAGLTALEQDMAIDRAIHLGLAKPN